MGAAWRLPPALVVVSSRTCPGPGDERSTRTGGARTKGDVWWLLALTVVFIAAGMAYSLWWPAVVRHRPFYWLTPGDTWYSVRTAHWVAWGSLSYVYSNYRSELITLPGFNVLLAPVVMLASALHLSEIAPGIPGPLKPTEWLLVGPFSLACSGVTLFALDALARHVGLETKARRVLSIAEAAAVWPVIAMWGHPEDAVGGRVGRVRVGHGVHGAMDRSGVAARWRDRHAAPRRDGHSRLHRGCRMAPVGATAGARRDPPGLLVHRRRRPRFPQIDLGSFPPTGRSCCESPDAMVGALPQARTRPGFGRHRSPARPRRCRRDRCLRSPVAGEPGSERFG